MKGENLDIGASRNVQVGNFACTLNEISSSKITCKTQPFDDTGKKLLKLTIDDCEREDDFEVYPDPEFLDATLNLETQKWLGDNPQSIPAFFCGGSSIILKFKTNPDLFDETHRPRIYFNQNDTYSICEKREEGCKARFQKSKKSSISKPKKF